MMKRQTAGRYSSRCIRAPRVILRFTLEHGVFLIPPSARWEQMADCAASPWEATLLQNIPYRDAIGQGELGDIATVKF